MIRTRAPLRDRITGLSAARRAPLIFVMAGLVFSAIDSLTKALVADVPVIDAVWGRYLTFVVVMVVVAGRNHPRRLFVTSRLGTQIARGLAMSAVTTSFFFALSVLPLAEVTTLSSITPLIVVCLAGPMLGERVHRSAVIGAAVGFGGVLILIGIDPGHFDPAMLAPLGAALAYSIFSLLTRALRAERPDVTLFYAGAVGLAVASVLFVFVPTTSSPTPVEWAAIAFVGVGGLSAHRLLVAAYRWGRASDLAPLGYLGLVWAFVIGAIVFGEQVQLRALIGAGAIAVGGIVALRGAPDEERDILQTSVDFDVSAEFGDGMSPDQNEVAAGAVDSAM